MFKLHRLEDEADDGTAGSAAGNGAPGDAAAPAQGADTSAVPAKADQGAAAPAAEPGKSKADTVKAGMLDAINKVLDAPAAEEKPDAAKAAEVAAAASADKGSEPKATAADARKYLVAKGQAKDLAGKTDAEVLKLYDTAKAAEPAGEAKGDKAKKPTDAELFKMPEGLKKDGQVRFQKLVEATKAERAEREKVEIRLAEREQTVTGFRKILEETHTGPEEMSMLLEYNRMVKTGDLEGALKVIDEQRRQIAQALGRPVDGVDLLEGYDDLKTEVKEEKITPERAAEIATARREREAARRADEQRRRGEQSQDQRKQVREKALTSISEFAYRKSKEDIDYKKKEDILLAAVERISKKFPPEHWLAALEEAYEAITVTAVAAVPTNGEAAKSAAQPLRPNAGGGGVATPKTMGAAIDQALGYGS